MEHLCALCSGREDNAKSVMSLGTSYGLTSYKWKTAETAEKLWHVILMG